MEEQAFPAALAGEVRAIKISRRIEAALPGLAPQPYACFVRANGAYMALTECRAASYWDANHRRQHPPGTVGPARKALAALRDLAAKHPL